MSMNQRRVGKYELQQRLAGGTMGEVWKAFDTQQHRYVAIKVIAVDAQQDSADFTSRFYHEAQILTTLRHPHIVAVQDFRMLQGGSEAYIIMDYVEGSSLADYLKRTAHAGNIPSTDEIVHVLAAIASALDYALQRGVIHGALRPAAILLDRTNATSSAPGEPKLTDFGLNYLRNPLAFPLDDMPYISPEVAQGLASTNRSDLYSLGAILYEMYTGALPFSGDTPGDILMQHIHGTPTSPALINPHIPPALTAAIMRSLARDPAARFPSATALVTTVANALNVSIPESISHSRPLSVIGNPPSLSGISGPLDTMNSPTYPVQQSQQAVSPGSVPVPPVVASGNTPVLSPPPVISSSTPILSQSLTDSAAGVLSQTEMNMPTLLTSTPSRAVSAGSAVPVTSSVSSPPLQAPGQTSLSPTPAPPVRKKRPRGLYLGLVAALLVVLVGSTFGIYHFTGGTSSTQSPVVGHAFFVSSGLLSSENSNQGISDGLQLNLQNLPPPASGKNYYGWLLSDLQSVPDALSLGPLLFNHGQVTKTYSDPRDNNLLANYNRLLITEEGANPPPTIPSTDTSTWRYYAAFSTTPNPLDTVNHFSVYDHLKHLLAADPKLAQVNLSGGLDIWLYRNTAKILEQAGSARDAQKQCAANPNNAAACGFVHRALVRILDYLDGSQYVWEDVPGGQQVLIDPTVARVAMLEFDSVKQFPPGYLDHIGNHLREIVLSPGVTAEQRVLATRITQAINNVQVWVTAIHHDAAQLVKMNNSQLASSASIFNDMFTNANYAFVGKFDPNTNTVKEGVVQIHYNIQGMATFDVTPCTVTNGQSSCA